MRRCEECLYYGDESGAGFINHCFNEQISEEEHDRVRNNGGDNCQCFIQEALKPCPFCGGKAFVNTIEHNAECRPNGYRFHGEVMCHNCQAVAGTTGFDVSYAVATERAIKAWNRRVND